ncbi:MAG: hypothetical protein K6B65_03215 [Bacilli bacterium]|nr:hypothetical protein [Bacilli bacterium]
MFQSLAKMSLPLILGSFLLSCAYLHAPTQEENVEPVSETLSKETISKQLSSIVKSGLRLDMSSLKVAIPSKIETVDNVLDFSGAHAKLRVDELSLHGIEAEIAADLDYNGVNKDVDFLLSDEELYFSLVDHANLDGFRFKSSIKSYDESDGGYDETTRGVLYYEYGSLDYFLYSVFESFDLPSISLDLSSNGESASIDFSSIADATNSIEQIDAHTFKLSLPVGEETLPIGLYSDSEGTLSKIGFPYGQDEYEFSNGVKVSFLGEVSTFSEAFTLPYEESQYLNLSDSLELIKDIGSKITNKKFGVEANLNVYHKEDAVEGSEELFSRDALEESATLTANVDVDLSESYHDLTAAVALSSSSSSETIDLHIDDDSGTANCYFDFNSGVLKGFSSVSAFSSLWNALSTLMSNEDIQNNEIMALLSGLLATSDSISAAIDGVKTSAVGTAISEGHYEGILNAIDHIAHEDNKIVIDLDLSHAGGSGSARIVLDSNATNLLEVTLDNAGIVTTTSPALSLLVSGSVILRDYELHSFDASSYEGKEYRHLPSLASSLEKFAGSDQLSADISGYMIQKGTTAVTSYTLPSWDGNSTFASTGFSFSGSLGFDLEEKTGAGKMTFVDRKEGYFNDHNIYVDVTGGEGENDTNEKDFSGNEGDIGETGYMLAQYDSKNADTSNSSEKRTNPNDDSSPIKGRFSIHSLDNVLDSVAELLSSTDPRFKRLTNLFNGVMNESIISSIIDGYYLKALSEGFFESSYISDNGITIVAREGFIYSGYELSIRVSFGEDYLDEEGVTQPGKIKTLEILSQNKDASDGTDIYAKIELHSASFPNDDIGFNFINKDANGSYSWKSGHSLSEFTSFSSIGNLVNFLLDTITLGTTDSSTVTTYHLHLYVDLDVPLISSLDTTIEADFYIYLDGTNVKILGNLHYEKSKFLAWGIIDKEAYVNIFYETSGEDSDGDLYITRSVPDDSEMTTTRRVDGSDFSANMLDWLSYIFYFGDTITEHLDNDSSSSSSEALHGEDLIKGFSTTGSYANPYWNLTVDIGSVLPSSLERWLSFEQTTVTIGGSTVSYSNAGKSYEKQTLSSLDTTLKIKLLGASWLSIEAKVDIDMKNAANNVYTDAWNSGSTCAYYMTSTAHKILGATIWTDYDLHTDHTGTPSAIFSGQYGKSTSNSTYNSTPYYVTPDTLA